jgi:HD-like signal output (HDOD) protein
MNPKKRILFVDDEPLVLQGLRRMLRQLQTEWEMAFVESGPAALELMAQRPFDVVVSDMRMPGMNGAELLNEVKKRHPGTIRLILSGHADKELILKCVGATHQYLAKPCDPAALKATLLRAAALEGSLASDRLKELVARMDRLPSIPTVYSEIVEKLQDPEATLDAVGEVLSKDIGMTANILKLVNSAFFGLRRQVTHPGEAAAYLGLETIKSLVLSLHAFSQFEGVDLGGFDLPALWQHSLTVAAHARAIAAAEQAEAKVRDESFVTGLLHDAGKVVLAANFAAQYAEVLRMVRDRGLELLVAEEEVFGANHADVGGYLLGLWGLPAPVVEAIALHHNPARSLGKTFSPLTAVHVANALACCPAELSEGRGTAPVDTNYLAELGLVHRLPAWQAAASPSAAEAA